MTYVNHWDEVAERRLDIGGLHGAWQDLGRAAGMTWSSVKRIRVDPGARPTPAHAHGRDEEFFFVLGGSGLSWQDGATHEVGEGDVILHRPEGPAHTLIAGESGLEVLVFGPDSPTSLTRLPRAEVFWVGPWWIADDAGPQHPFSREPVEISGEPADRPATTIHYTEGRERVVARGATDIRWLDAGRAAGSMVTGLRHGTIAAGAAGPPPHCHSAEDEIFVVTGGSGSVMLGDDAFQVRRGSVVGRPAGTGVAHSFEAGPDGLELLAWGTRDPGDLAYFPRSQKVFFRGLGVVGRIEPLGYWDGEE
jgi:uncharacterized cupin superfamily protein